MANWSDKQLAGHKRAQGYISSTGATLGIAALGAAGLKSKGVRTALSRIPGRRGETIQRAAHKAGKQAQNLTIGSAGVGGVGGYNFAAIQSQEARRAKVGKNMSISPWGVDHGSDVSKSMKSELAHYNKTGNPFQRGITVDERTNRSKKNARIQGTSLKGWGIGAAGGAAAGAVGGLATSAVTRGRVRPGSGSGLGAAIGGAVGSNIGAIAGKKKGIEREYPGTTLGAYSWKPKK